jgi:SAM-dependent methyltransferase
LTFSPRARPDEYGRVWKRHQGGLDWYTWMYQGRAEQHRCLQQWFAATTRREPIASVLEMGCGLGVGYADFFAQLRYVGADLSGKEIEWCRENRRNPRHEYVACDFIEAPFPERFDLVFSQGTIDNTYDMDAFLRAAVAASTRWVYVTAYRGFFPDLDEHVYRWNEGDGCYYNDLSAGRATATLRESGCREVAVVPSFTGRAEIPFETLILGRVGR